MNKKEYAIDKISKSMHLRKPQKEALLKLHEIVNSSSKKLTSMSSSEITELFFHFFPNWQYASNSLEFTLHLATGVGKTRLIGAIMAYLFLSGESSHFLIVSPRAEIISKFKKVCDYDNKDYIFVDKNLVGVPQILDPEYLTMQGDLFEEMYTGPKIMIMTPQAFTATDAKIKRKDEYESKSVFDYLKDLKDLIIFFDESHHLGLEGRSLSVWHSELLALSPMMLIGTTASVNNESMANVLYSYPLTQCLNEKKYTKLVRIIADKKDDTVSEDDYDAVILRFGLKRLELKQQELNDYHKNNPDEKEIKAVMLVCCDTISHAQQTTDWLQHYLGRKDQVLLVHSKLKENEFASKLSSIEDIRNPARVIVNVSMLNEGWDVSNIYVVTPLRSMASSTLVTQVMGRGLRLPFGKQTGNQEVDTLDVLCFGRETMQEICDKLLSQGYGVSHSGIEVKERRTEETREFIPSKKIKLEPSGEITKLEIPSFSLNKPLLNLSDITIPPLKKESLHAFYISDPQTISRLNGAIDFDKDEFIGLVSSEILKRCPYLSFSRHYQSLYSLVLTFIESCGFEEARINLEPEKVINHIKRCLDSISRTTKANYTLNDEDLIVDLNNCSVNVPSTFENPIEESSFALSTWTTRDHKGIPFSGWRRSLLKFVPFDQVNELKIAKIIDRSDKIKWWFRNVPGLLTLPTPAGNYSPDFAMLFEIDNTNVLLEIKGDIYYGMEDEDATIKANAAKEWVKAQSEATNQKWQYWLLLDSDANICSTLEDIMDNAEID